MFRNFGSITSSILCICVIAIAGPVFADKKTDAKKHFKYGLSFLDSENYESAANEFEASVKLYPTRNGLFNLANCYLSLSRYKEAMDTMDRLVKLFKGKIDEAWQQAIAELEKKLDENIVRLEIYVNVDNASILINGQEVGKTPLSKPLILEIGKHEIAISQEGYRTENREVVLDSGGKTKLMLTLEREPKEAETPATTPAVPKDTKPIIKEEDKRPLSGLLIGSICAGGLGLVGVGVGVYFSVQYNNHADEVNQAQDLYNEDKTNTDNYSKYENVYNDANDNKFPRDKVGMAIGYSVGGALVATGAVLFIVNQVREKNRKSESIAVMPTLHGLVMRF